ncbi:MAG: hypothetical protein ABIV25_12745 [Paracoccaceae bacterium]
MTPKKDKPMEYAFTNFCQDDCGAVTIDWVVLSAAIIGIGMLVLTPIALSTDSVSQSVANDIGGLNSGYGNNN